MCRLVVLACLFWSFLCAAVPAIAAPGAPPLVFGVVAKDSATATFARWYPFVHELGLELDRPVHLRISSNNHTFEACLLSKAYDVAFMEPFQLVAFSQAPGYRLLARPSGPVLNGVIVARKDRNITDLSQLHGSRLAFPSATSFVSSRLVREDLANHGVPFVPVYVNSDESVFLTVAAGAIVAGGVEKESFDAANEALRNALEIVHVTRSFAPYAFAVSPNISHEEQGALHEAVQALSEKHPAVLADLGIGRLRSAGSKGYEDVEELVFTRNMPDLNILGNRACPLD